MSKKPLIISTDPGIDDIAAMTISLFAAELDVKMIVPTWGNVSLAHTLQNTLDLENFLHTKVPVVKGANQPLVQLLFMVKQELLALNLKKLMMIY